MVKLLDVVYRLVGIGAYASLGSGGHLSSNSHPACIQIWSPRILKIGREDLKVSLKQLSMQGSCYRT